MQFKDQTWSHRFREMGDIAEARFEQYAADKLKLGFVRYGLNRPPIGMKNIPARLRYTPDYLMHDRLVEVQGFGRDQKLKFKMDKLNSLRWWNDFKRDGFVGVSIYVWDSHRERETMFDLGLLDRLLADGHGELGSFAEGKPYLAWDADTVFAYAS